MAPLLSVGHTGTHLLIPVKLRSRDSLGYCNDTGWFTALWDHRNSLGYYSDIDWLTAIRNYLNSLGYCNYMRWLTAS